MIDVKAARRSADTPHSPAEVIARSETDQPLSMRGPGLLLAIMATAIAYLQSLVGKSEAATPPEVDKEAQAQGEALAATAQPQEEEVPTPPAVVEPEDETGSISRENDRPIGSGQPGPAVPGIGDFLGIDSPAFDFAQIPLPVTAAIRPPPGLRRGRQQR